LLAKQGWRIVQDPNSLVSQVLKAKYFPQGSFLLSEVGTRPSFVWRSLLSAKELLMEGLVWRIGDGKSIKIWQDKWLPTPISFSVQSPPRFVPDDSSVLVLIDSKLCGWKEDLITPIFNSKEARVVVSIPLCPTLPPDRLVWRGTKNGVFLVQSAYYMGMEIKKRNNGSTSRDEDRHNVWSTLWSLGVSNSVKIFLWRACNDLLPIKCNLFKMNIVKDNICPCCCREIELGLHALWTCLAVQDVWGGGSMIFQKCAFLGDTFMQLVEFCLDRLNSEEFSLMAVISRRIWLRRNKFIFESLFTHPRVVFNEAVSSLEEYRRFNSRDNERSNINGVPASKRPPSVWRPPPLGVIKVNWDASINAKKKYVGIGIVARDNNGEVLGARAITKLVVATPKVAEAMVALAAVLFCKATCFFFLR
jgi:hypothetical protein